MRLLITPRARRTLDRIFDYIEERDERAAERTVDRILQLCLTLSNFPQIGRAGRVDRTREMSVPSVPYFVVYRTRGEVLEVLDVIHTSRRYP